MSGVDVVASHHERVTLRVGDTFVKVDGEDWRIEREAAALAHVTVPRPPVRWRRPHVLALGAVEGEPLGALGQAASASAAAWRAAGSIAREIHESPIPDWPGWEHDGARAFLDDECRWLVDHDVAPSEVVDRLHRRAEPAFRPFESVCTHGDLQAAHVLVLGDAVTAVLDWADARPGDALFDLAVLTVGHRERLPDVVAGYGTDVDVEVIRGWWAVRKLSSTRWMIEHGLDAAGDIAELHRFAGE